LKKAVNDQGKKKKKKNGSQSDEDADDKTDDLAQITGGKDAEIEQYSVMLQKITEDKLIQEGLLGRFLEPILNIAYAALNRYAVNGAQQIKQLQ
jgi:hypothetical protein